MVWHIVRGGKKIQWPSDAKCVVETEPEQGFFTFSCSGIYAVDVEYISSIMNVVLQAHFSKDKNLRFYFLEYYPSDVVCAAKEEIVLKQCNIVTVANSLTSFIDVANTIVPTFWAEKNKQGLKTYEHPINRTSQMIKNLLLTSLRNKEEVSKIIFTAIFYSENILVHYQANKCVINLSLLIWGKTLDMNIENPDAKRTMIEEFAAFFGKGLMLGSNIVDEVVNVVSCCIGNKETDILEAKICMDAFYIAVSKLTYTPVDENLLMVSDISPILLKMDIIKSFEKDSRLSWILDAYKAEKSLRGGGEVA